MPAGGAIAAAYCFERKCRHIPLEWQRADAVVEPSNTLSYQEPCMPERSDEPIRAIHTQCLCARSYMTLANPKTVKFYHSEDFMA